MTPSRQFIQHSHMIVALFFLQILGESAMNTLGRKLFYILKETATCLQIKLFWDILALLANVIIFFW